MPLTMFCFERENEHARILKTIASIPFLNVMIRLKRIYLKLRVKLTKDASYRRSIENERFFLKMVRSTMKSSKD
jgi:hypothetical protein